MSALVRQLRGAVGGAAIVAPAVVRLEWPKLRRLMRVNSLFSEKNIVRNFSDMRGIFFHKELPVKSDDPLPLPARARDLPERFSFRGREHVLATWRVERNQTAMVVLKDGQIAYEDYRLGTGPHDRRISWSMAKSFLSAAFGCAVRDGLIPSLDAYVTEHVPELAGTAYEGVTIRNVLNMASGIRFNEDYLDFHSDINRMGRVLALGKSMDGFAAGLKERARPPGSAWQYVSIDTHVLGMVLRGATRRSNADYLAETILRPIGMEADAYYLTDGFGIDFVLGGLNMRTRDYARFGLMMCNRGRVGETQVVPEEWVRQSTTHSGLEPSKDDQLTDNGQLGYGFQWWLPPLAEEGEFFAIGIYGQYIYVNQRAGVVIAVNSVDRRFREGDGRITLANIEMFREIARSLS